MEKIPKLTRSERFHRRICAAPLTTLPHHLKAPNIEEHNIYSNILRISILVGGTKLLPKEVAKGEEETFCPLIGHKRGSNLGYF